MPAKGRTMRPLDDPKRHGEIIAALDRTHAELRDIRIALEQTVATVKKTTERSS